jgi:mono/diheme cytochrome c family protein
MSGGDAKSTWWSQAQGLLDRYAVVTGIGVTFLLFAFIVVPALVRERQPRPLPPSDQPAAASAGWLSPADAPPSKGKDLPPIDPATVMTATPKLLARGETLFKQQCSSCHGDTGHGDGPAAASLTPKPRNFSQPGGWTRGYHIPEVFTTISEGIKGTGMAAFDFITPADRMALVHYVRSLGGFDHGADDAQKLEALANQFRSKGVHIPNRIPVSLAIRKMVKEQPAVPALRLPEPTDHSETAELVRAVLADAGLAAHTVAGAGKQPDRDAVARAWMAGAPRNGFATAAATLTPEQWRQVTTALLGNEAPTSASSNRGTLGGFPRPPVMGRGEQSWPAPHAAKGTEGTLPDDNPERTQGP